MLADLLSSIEVESSNKKSLHQQTQLHHKRRRFVRQSGGVKKTNTCDAATDASEDYASYGPWKDQADNDDDEEEGEATTTLKKGNESKENNRYGPQKKFLESIAQKVANDYERRRLIEQKYLTPRLPEIAETQLHESMYNDATPKQNNQQTAYNYLHQARNSGFRQISKYLSGRKETTKYSSSEYSQDNDRDDHT